MNYLYHYIITRLCIVSPWWSNEIPIYFYSALIDVDKVVIRESVGIIPGLYVNYKSFLSKLKLLLCIYRISDFILFVWYV